MRIFGLAIAASLLYLFVAPLTERGLRNPRGDDGSHVESGPVSRPVCRRTSNCEFQPAGEAIMSRKITLVLMMGMLGGSLPLSAQQPCVGFSVVVNTPEDVLMLAVNGAETPQEQIAALDNFFQEHADAKFIPCAHEYSAIAHMRARSWPAASPTDSRWQRLLGCRRLEDQGGDGVQQRR